MKLLRYEKDYDLYVEVNNYLYFLSKVCENKKGVRRFAYRLCYLFEKLSDLSFSDSEDSPLYLRNKRRALRYAKEVKKNIKNIKLGDISVFELASKKLVRNNLDVYDDSLRDFSRYIGLDAEKISRVLSGDLSNMFANKRLIMTKFNLDNKMSEMEQQMGELEKTLELSYDDYCASIEDIKDTDEYNSSKRVLNKTELEQLKKEIDSGDAPFVNFNNISLEQRDIINNYAYIRDCLSDFISSVKGLDKNIENIYIIDLYRKLYSIVAVIVNAKFEQVIHLSKVIFKNSSSYVMDRNVVEVFGISSSLLSYVDNVVQVFGDKFLNHLSNSEKEELKQELWHHYKLCGITSSDINEDVSFNILAFIMENPFALLQTVPSNLSNSDTFKKYDLSVLLDFVISELAGTTIHVVKSIEKDIEKSNEYSDEEKGNILSYIKEIFSQKYVFDLGVDEMPECSYEYFVRFVMEQVYSDNTLSSEMKMLRDDVIDKIYNRSIRDYKSLSLFSRLSGSNPKPSYNDIRDKIVNFENKLLKNALKVYN